MSSVKQCLHLLFILSFIIIHSSIAANIDPYKILKVPKHATQKEIRKAFKNAALKYHPDRNLKSSDPDKMAKISSAYEILGDPARRKEHDESVRQEQIYAAHGFRTRSGSSTSNGIGAALTTYNYYNLLYNINDRPWLILAYEDFSQACKQALAIFEEACIKLSGLARCAKIDVNKQSALINEFGLRRVPHFVTFFNLNGKQYQKAISWRGRQKIKTQTLIENVAQIFPIKCTVIQSIKQMELFLNDVAFNDAYFNKVKAVIFSDAKKRYSPHILLEYLATSFEQSIDFGYVHMDVNKPKNLNNAYSMATMIGLDADELEPPSMYILRAPLILKQLLEKNGAYSNKLSTLEDMGIYHVSLSADVDGMKGFVEQYSMPIMPKIDGNNYLETCFMDGHSQEDGHIDEDKICYLFVVNKEDEHSLSKLFLFGQYVLASFEESVQFGWVNCVQQNEFCKSMKLESGDESNEKVQIVAIKAYREYYQIFDDESKGMILKDDQNENEGLVKNVVAWIKVLERDSVVFGDENKCDEENNTKCEENNQEEMWKKGVLFPQKTPKWNDRIDDVIGSFNSIFGVVGDTVGSGFNAIGSLLSSLFQIFFVIILFMFLLPMLRMAR